MGYELLARIIEDYREFSIARFDIDASVVYDQLKNLNLKIGTMDLRIASIAISRNLVLVTRNTRDFSQIPALKMEDWTR
jgi:tRNA(fMet)-specific endonuclease VapC